MVGNPQTFLVCSISVTYLIQTDRASEGTANVEGDLRKELHQTKRLMYEYLGRWVAARSALMKLRAEMRKLQDIDK